MPKPSKDMQFTAMAPLLTALALRPPTEAERMLCSLQGAVLEAMSEIEQNHPKQAWRTLKVALQEAA